MLASGCYEEQILAAAAEVNVRVYDLRRAPDKTPLYPAYRFTLKTGDKWQEGSTPRTAKAPYRRFSAYATRTIHHPAGAVVEVASTIPGAVCWHGHRDFFRALYRRCPQAWIKTALATYTGAEQFERAFPSTQEWGERMGFPLEVGVSLCSCQEE